MTPALTCDSTISSSPPRPLVPASLYRLGRRAYEPTWRLQQRWVQERLSDRRPDSLMLLEHDPVFTAGRRAQEGHWRPQRSVREAAGIPLHHVERGGSVTYHGPGQIVGYPIMRLRPPFAGPKAFVTLLEETLLRVLADWRLTGFRRERLHGVWIERNGVPLKVAAVGVRIVRGVTMHGFALNVCPDLRPFEWIVPCGIAGCHVTSMSALLDSVVACEEVTVQLAARFAETFGLMWAEESLDLADHLDGRM